ncbi:MAG: HEAT repeat domain-containing protein [Bacteroidota bacterium]
MLLTEIIAWGSLYERFQGYPLFIQIALVVIVLSVSLFLLGNAGLALERYETTYRETKTKEASTLVMDELVGNLVLDESVTETEFNSFVGRVGELSNKSRIFNQVVIDQIIFYHRNFTDSTDRIVKRLFSRLNLIESALRKIKSSAWELKAKGLREMQEMHPEEQFDNLVEPLLNDENDDLRVEAQATFLSLHTNNPFDFLASATEELLPWHQILLYDIIVNNPDIPVPDLNKFLQSKNASVVSFAIKLTDHYNQMETVPQLITLLDHSDLHIRMEAIKVLGKLNAEEAEPVMIDKYAEENIKVKINILESVGNIRSGYNIAFLKEQFLEAEEFALIKTAGCALAIYPEFHKEEFVNDAHTISPQRETIINHCTNTLIRN